MNHTAKTLNDGLVAYKQRHYREAAEIWTTLAEQGDAEAQYSLGVMYKEGIGVPQDHGKAINWLKKSCDQGHEHARLIVDVLEGDSENDLSESDFSENDFSDKH